MKLYVLNKNKQKVYLNLTAATRGELARKIGGVNFYLENNRYSIGQVIAESDANNTATGTVVGGVLGLLAGPVGLLIGGLIGGFLGNSSDGQEVAIVNRFNESK